VPNLMTRVLLFVSSYAPLLAILWVRKTFGDGWFSWAIFGLALLSVAVLVIYLTLARRLAAHEVIVRSSSSKDGEAMSYLVSYLLPFLGLDSQRVADQVSLGIFLAMVAVLYVGSNLIHMNPMLNLVGFRILEVECEHGGMSTLICRKNYIRPGTSISVVSLSNHVLMEKGA